MSGFEIMARLVAAGRLTLMFCVRSSATHHNERRQQKKHDVDQWE